MNTMNQYRRFISTGYKFINSKPVYRCRNSLPFTRRMVKSLELPDQYDHNPLQRMERLGTGWFGCIIEMDGVLFQDSSEVQIEAWIRVAHKLNYPRPLYHILKRIRGIRDDIIISSIFHWTNDLDTIKRIINVKNEIIFPLMNKYKFDEIDTSVLSFIKILVKNNIPIGIACGNLSRMTIHDRLKNAGIYHLIKTMVTSDDVGVPELDWYIAQAALQIERPPTRCILVGNSNSSIDIARSLGMKCIILSGNHPIHDFQNADLVVQDLSCLTFQNLRNLNQ